MEKTWHSREKAKREVKEIGLWLDTYEDIFSDFDPRPLSVRALSDDLIGELRKACGDTDGSHVKISLLLPAKRRRADQEKIILERLSGHFHKHYKQSLAELRSVWKKGMIYISLGLVVMLSGGYLTESPSVVQKFLKTLMEPAGWFLLWSGLDHFISLSQGIRKDRKFYEILTGAKIEFKTITKS